MSVQNKFENTANNLILWQILEFLSNGKIILNLEDNKSIMNYLNPYY